VSTNRRASRRRTEAEADNTVRIEKERVERFARDAGIG
jgi:hypothetical protein